MHACGHDGHITLGIGVLEAVADSDFEGTLKLFFQPAEERVGGGKAMAESGHLDDVDYFYAVHLGLDHPTGEVVAGIDGFLAVSHLLAEFQGESSHAGAHPEEGRNAVQAMATAIQNLYAIPRHDGGATRVNAGRAGGGTATNIVPEEAFVEGEVRGETTELMRYMKEKAERVLESSADMHDCEVTLSTEGEAPSATSDQALVDVFAGEASALARRRRERDGARRPRRQRGRDLPHEARPGWGRTRVLRLRGEPTTPAATTRRRSTWTRTPSTSASTRSPGPSSRSASSVRSGGWQTTRTTSTGRCVAVPMSPPRVQSAHGVGWSRLRT